MNLIELLREELNNPAADFERREELLMRALHALEICHATANSIGCCEDCRMADYSSCDVTSCIHSLSLDVARMRENIRAAIEAIE